MGSWRKVGAFLGLVPDDSHQYDGEGYEPGGYERPAGYERGSYGPGEYPPAQYGADQYSADQHGADQYSADSYGRDGYGPADPSVHRGDEVADRGFAGSTPYSRTDGASSTSGTESYRREPADADPTRGPRSGRRGFSAEPVTQGALAMKADQRRDDSSTAARPASVTLTGFGEARIVGEKYREGQSVILDMTGMSDADARRLVDFSAGLAFSLRGSIEKVAPKVFMLLPAEADIAGGAATALEDARAYVGSSAGR